MTEVLNFMKYCVVTSYSMFIYDMWSAGYSPNSM